MQKGSAPVSANLLIVEDEPNLRSTLEEYFERNGFRVTVANDGRQALELAERTHPDLIILDVGLPYTDGLQVCRAIRQRRGNTVGIIMISGAYKEMVDRVVGLELGSDIYMTKPFETRELLAQARALLRRIGTHDALDGRTGWFEIDGDLRIHFDRRMVEFRKKEVHLTRLEFDLLRYLAERPGVPCGRSDLVDAVWGYEAGGDINDSAINTCIAKLRRKIEPDPSNPRYIQSVHGIGYRFKEPQGQ